MTEFFKTRLKLTAWYLLIVTFVSFFFSFSMYRILTLELDRNMQVRLMRFIPGSIGVSGSGFFFGEGRLPLDFDRPIFEETKQRIALALVFANGVILAVAGLAAYFLAGKSLEPLEKAIEEQKRFVADASHELRTPLTAIKTEVEVALRDKGLNLASAKKLLQSNLEETNKMQSLSNNLLILSKYQSADYQPEFEPVRFMEVLDKAKEKLLAKIAERKISIEVEGEDVEFEANYNSMVELFTILLDNTIKYSNESGAVIVKTQVVGKSAFFLVQDFGVGIKDEDISKIFDRFYRSDSSRVKDQADGYGLGLSIAKSIVEMHKGKIWVESKLGEGSTFKVELPIKQSAS